MSSSSDSEGKIFASLCFGVVLGIGGFWGGFQLRKKKKLIEDIPTSTVRGMAMGLVEVKGKAQSFKGTVKSPFAQVDSVFFHYKIEEYRSSGRSGSWVTIKEFATPDWFFLEDDTGRVLVNPVGAELFLNVDRQYQLNSFGGKDKQAFEEGLIALGVQPHGFMGFDKQLRCAEQYVCPGDPLYVMGATAKNPLMELSDKGNDNACIQKEGAPFFCLSDKSEKDLLSSLGGQMYLFLYGGPVLTVACLFFLIAHYFKSMF